jgi:hypothetical protein
MNKVISISSDKSLAEEVSAHSADNTEKTARELLTKGLKELDRRLDSEGVHVVFADFEKAYDSFIGYEPTHWMLHLNPKSYGRAIIRAQEYGKSAGGLAGMCIAYAKSPINEPWPSKLSRKDVEEVENGTKPSGASTSSVLPAFYLRTKGNVESRSRPEYILPFHV